MPRALGTPATQLKQGTPLIAIPEATKFVKNAGVDASGCTWTAKRRSVTPDVAVGAESIVRSAVWSEISCQDGPASAGAVIAKPKAVKRANFFTQIPF